MENNFKSLLYWCNLYRKHLHESVCLDIETSKYDGPISLVGLYKPKDGIIEYDVYVKDINLNEENLRQAFSGCKMIITFNGLNHDIKKIKNEFKNVIPENVIIIDLYLFARRLNMNTNLRVLENTFNIERLHKESEEKGQAIRLWQRYERFKDKNALDKLIEYNKQDTINLYPLAEKLINKAEEINK